MREEIKKEIIEQIEKDILFGFAPPEEIQEGILDMFFDENDLDEEWIRKKIIADFEKQNVIN